MAPTSSPDPPRERPVVCRVSTHTLRLEREYQLFKHIVARSDPECKHFARPVDFIKLPPKPGNSEPLVASIFEVPGISRLRDLVSFGPNAYRVVKKDETWQIADFNPPATVPLLTFLDFAVGATECLEILHHGHEVVHGELRGDAFHFAENGKVEMINFGGGARAFESGLTSAGWSTISQEPGIENKLSYIAPEQTGRLPAEPDSRTDIYSLGILFYSMLCGGTPFEGNTPLDIMQSVLSKRIPLVSTKRIDIPDALSSIIGKMTRKNIEERYHSTSGLKYDLVKIRELLSEGDTAALSSFAVGSKDISCFFNLPLKQIGRDKERKAIVDVIERVSKRRRHSPMVENFMNSMSSESSYSDPRIEPKLEDIISDSTSSQGSDVRLTSTPGPSVPPLTPTKMHEVDPPPEGSATEKSPPFHRFSNHSINGSSSLGSTLSRSTQSSGGSMSLFRTSMANVQSSARTRRKKTRCEVVAIGGSTGLGKSRLVASKHNHFPSGPFPPKEHQLISDCFRSIVTAISCQAYHS